MDEHHKEQSLTEAKMIDMGTWYEPLIKETFFSRYFSTAIFILLPFIGFLLGVGYVNEHYIGEVITFYKEDAQRNPERKETALTEHASTSVPVTCYQNSNFFVVEPVESYTRSKDVEYFIVKEQLMSHFRKHVCEYVYETEDYLIENESGTGHVVALEDKFLILDYGTSLIRSLIVYNLETGEIVYKDVYNKKIEIDRNESGVILDYWRVADDTIPITEENCPDHIEDYLKYGGGAGINEFVQVNLETLHKEVIGRECVYRQ